MVNLFDMMMQAQDGQATHNMARQFGLTAEQAQAAVAAMLPAFSHSLKRTTATQQGLVEFMQALASGRHAPAFEDAAAAFRPETRKDGNGVLGHLFGSKEVSRALAAQTAEMTGIDANVLKQMMPVIASMIMGALASQTRAPQARAQNAPLQDMMEAMFRQMTGGMMGGPTGDVPPHKTPAAAGNPWEDMLGAMFGTGRQAADEPPGSAPVPGMPDTGAGAALFGEMFEAGRQAQRSQLKAFDDMLDAVFGAETRPDRKA